MKLYFFGGDFSNIDKVYDAKFDGNLFLYNSSKFEHFTELSYNASKIKNDFRYMVAIRPYAISPQYLSMIYRNLYNNFGDILEINLIAGYPKPEERLYNAFVGSIGDDSQPIEKSEYLIKYLESLDSLKKTIPPMTPNIYVSSTNESTLQATFRLGNKAIIPYHTYVKWQESINSTNTIVTITPVISNNMTASRNMAKDIGNDHIYGTENEVLEVLMSLKAQGAYGVLLAGFGGQQQRLFNFVAKHKESI